MRQFAALAVISIGLLSPTWAFAETLKEPSPNGGAALSQSIDREIVVDFVDGTTKAEFDELEQAWGIDLELNDEVEGPDSAITNSRGFPCNRLRLACGR